MEKKRENIEKENIEKFKIKRLIKSLSNYKGNGTSMISLILPPGTQIGQINKMLTIEYGTASNIKSRVNRQSVLTAITSTQVKLKTYNKIPNNGLIIYCGEANINGKIRKLNIDFEPFKPIRKKTYICDNYFHTENLNELLEDSETFGFIIIDGNGVNFYKLTGSNSIKIGKFDINLTSKTRRGGQSALRFSRNRDIQKNNFIRQSCEMATKYFIGNSNLPIVKGIIIAGSADFKNKLAKSQLLDQRLTKIILNIIDVSYGGDNGFKQAIEMSKDFLGNLKLMEEKKIISEFFNEISINSGKYCIGIKEVIDCLNDGAIEKLIIYEDLQIQQIITNEGDIKYLNKEKLENNIDNTNNIKEITPYIDYISEHYKDYGCELHIISNKTSSGNQIINGFGGLCGILRWKRTVINQDSDSNIDDTDDEFNEDNFI